MLPLLLYSLAQEIPADAAGTERASQSGYTELMFPLGVDGEDGRGARGGKQVVLVVRPAKRRRTRSLISSLPPSVPGRTDAGNWTMCFLSDRKLMSER